MHFMVDVLYYNESDKIEWAHFTKYYPPQKQSQLIKNAKPVPVSLRAVCK